MRTFAVFLASASMAPLVIAACAWAPDDRGSNDEELAGVDQAWSLSCDNFQAPTPEDEDYFWNQIDWNDTSTLPINHRRPAHLAAVERQRRIVVNGDGNDAWLTLAELRAQAKPADGGFIYGCDASAVVNGSGRVISDQPLGVDYECLRRAFHLKRTWRVFGCPDGESCPSSYADEDAPNAVDSYVFEVVPSFGQTFHPSNVVRTVGAHTYQVAHKNNAKFTDADQLPVAGGDAFDPNGDDVLLKYALNSIAYSEEMPEPPEVPTGFDFTKFDPLQEIIRDLKSRDREIEVFAGIRMNDTHAADPGNFEELISQFNLQFETSPPPFNFGQRFGNASVPYGKWSSVDYGAQLVRDVVVEMVRETLLRYPDLDGVQLNFARHFAFFKGASLNERPASDCEREKMNDMMRRIRYVADQAASQRGKPALISVIVPDGPAAATNNPSSTAKSDSYSRDIGLDLATWYEERLVDVVVGADYMQLQAWQTTVDEFGTRAPHAKFYAGFSNTRLLGNDSTDDDRMLRATPDAFRGRAFEALREGVDGIHLSNSEYSRGGYRGLYFSLGATQTASAAPMLMFGSYTGGREAVGDILPYHECSAPPCYINPSNPRPFVAPDRTLTLAAHTTRRWSFRVGGAILQQAGRLFIIHTGSTAPSVNIDGYNLTPSTDSMPTVYNYGSNVFRTRYDIDGAAASRLAVPTLKVDISVASTPVKILDVILQTSPTTQLTSWGNLDFFPQ